MFKETWLVIAVFLFAAPLAGLFSEQNQKGVEQGSFSIYFMEEKVGYEEYTWESVDEGYLLSVRAKMTKPIAMEIEMLTLRMNKSFIPSQFYLKGSINDLEQEVFSSIVEGAVENKIVVSGQEQKSTVQIRRDAFILPNPLFSPYMVLTKKYRCLIQDKKELSAYIIPQLEAPFSLEAKEGVPCSLVMQVSGMLIELDTDEEGNLKTIHIPSQKLSVIQNNT
ncbi:hypothetical protein ACFLRM_01335 [Acidobacteriota bacterium]